MIQKALLTGHIHGPKPTYEQYILHLRRRVAVDDFGPTPSQEMGIGENEFLYGDEAEDMANIEGHMESRRYQLELLGVDAMTEDEALDDPQVQIWISEEWDYLKKMMEDNDD